ncbi:glycosyltransferase family 9 protein [uncultured Kiloniella sp.]|uniref:glycosyltransferase family 9 protein n=1 Tax=uncultured Kiloniella sp. TaxID=1133091 RepID=UPI00260D224D|nr:glycosyltransferase family 9 protein [uncultured Kiloniella sp.]
MSELGKTLVVTGGGLGDTLFHMPFIRSIQQKSEGKSIVLACKKGREISELFSEIDMVSQVLPIAKDQDVSGKADLGRLRRLTKAAKIDTAFVFHKSTGISFAIMMAGVKNRYGYFFKGSWNRFFLNKGTLTPKQVPLPAFMHHAAMVMDDVGISYDYSDVRFRQPEHVVKAAFEGIGLPEKPKMIALGINASAAYKQWGVKGYSEIAERLLENYPGQILLFGAGDVAPIAQGILDNTASPDRFIDLTTRKVLLHHSHALLQSCDFYVGNDSFGLNLAAMSSMPAVGIFIKSYYFAYSDWIKPVISPSDDISEVTSEQAWSEIEKLL